MLVRVCFGAIDGSVSRGTDGCDSHEVPERTLSRSLGKSLSSQDSGYKGLAPSPVAV